MFDQNMEGITVLGQAYSTPLWVCRGEQVIRHTIGLYHVLTFYIVIVTLILVINPTPIYYSAPVTRASTL